LKRATPQIVPALYLQFAVLPSLRRDANAVEARRPTVGHNARRRLYPARSCASVNGVQIAEDKEGLWARATLAPDSAIRIALARVPGGTISKAELEEEDGRLIYSFEIKVAGKAGEDEVHVDARTGEVVKQEHES
jgi:uncharacterized membrane protein YkoI